MNNESFLPCCRPRHLWCFLASFKDFSLLVEIGCLLTPWLWLLNTYKVEFRWPTRQTILQVMLAFNLWILPDGLTAVHQKPITCRSPSAVFNTLFEYYEIFWSQTGIQPAENSASEIKVLVVGPMSKFPICTTNVAIPFKNLWLLNLFDDYSRQAVDNAHRKHYSFLSYCIQSCVAIECILYPDSLEVSIA